MPYAVKRPCTYPGCHELTDSRDARCDEHRKQLRKHYDNQRGSSTQRGYGYKWQMARENFLQRHPLCVLCHAKGRLDPATVVDHIIPHKGDMTLFWRVTNWQALCKQCHDSKTAGEGRWQ